MSEYVGEVALAEVASATGLLERMEDIRGGESGARVILVYAIGKEHVAEAPEEWALRALARFQLPVVFCWEGELAGALADLAFAADIRVCAAESSLKGPLIGEARARSLAREETAEGLISGGRQYLADELLDAGLVSTVTAPGAALAGGRRLAKTVASRGPIATRLGKEAIWRGLGLPLEQALRFETDLTLLLQTTKDRAEGVRAFLEKRSPNFTGE